MPLGEIATISWGDTSTTKAAYTESGFTAFSASGPDGQLPYADHDQPGVVLSAIGAKCGKTWLATGRWSCIKNTIWFRSANPEIDTAFLYYATAKPEFWPRRGAAQPFVSLGDAKQLLISVPTIEVQKKVVAILSVYDELIENNTRRIKILEEMAQCIYKEWFVNFRYPGHENVPLVDSELGPIPEGWEVSPASEAIDFNPRTSVDVHSGVRFVPMGSISESIMHVGEIERRSKASGAKFTNGDTLFARITPCLENGKTGFVQALEDSETACGSTEFIVMRSKAVTPEFVYLLARSDAFRKHAIASMSGATGRQRVRNECFDSYSIALPPGPLLNEFTSVVRPMFRLSYRLFELAKVHRETRDLLLPRLVSGEIDVAALDFPGE